MEETESEPETTEYHPKSTYKGPRSECHTLYSVDTYGEDTTIESFADSIISRLRNGKEKDTPITNRKEIENCIIGECYDKGLCGITYANPDATSRLEFGLIEARDINKKPIVLIRFFKDGKHKRTDNLTTRANLFSLGLYTEQSPQQISPPKPEPSSEQV